MSQIEAPQPTSPPSDNDAKLNRYKQSAKKFTPKSEPKFNVTGIVNFPEIKY